MDSVTLNIIFGLFLMSAWILEEKYANKNWRICNETCW